MNRRLLIFIFALLLFQLNGQEIIYHHSVFRTFVENKGQWPEDVLFKNHIQQGNIWIEKKGILFQLQDYSALHNAHFSQKPVKGKIKFKEKLVALRFKGAQEITTIQKKGKTDFYFNYFVGKNSDNWAHGAHGYSEFTMSEIYRGIDLHFVEDNNEIKYEFIVKPNIDPAIIQLQYTNIKTIKIDKKGNLIVATELGDIIEKRPTAYQIVNGKIIDIPCEFALKNGIVTFKLEEYNKFVSLVIDPTLIFATYDGALSDNFGMTATYDYTGAAFCGGTVYGNQFPMPDSSVYDPNSNLSSVNIGIATTDAFIAKYAPDGKTMLWSTFLGGGNNFDGTDAPQSLICDKNNDVYVYGTTSSQDFPTTINAFQSAFNGGTPMEFHYNGVFFDTYGTDIYVAKLSSDGHQLLGSTYVGGEKNDGINYAVSSGYYGSAAAYDSLTSNYGDQFRGEIMLDSVHNVIIGSCTRSSTFPTKNAFQSTLAGKQDGVLFKLKNDFTDLIFSSYVGGSSNDAVYSVKVDSSHNIVFAGGTASQDFPVTLSCYQSTYGGGSADGFVAKLPPAGNTLLYATYLGTANYDQVFFVEIDRMNNIFTLGQSDGGNFPVINANYSNPNSGQFIAKFPPDLSSITASTVFGSGSGSFDISPSAFMVDICGNMYVSGWGANILQSSLMSGMPITPDAFQSTAPNGYDFYLIVIKRGFNGLLYGTYMGGNQAQEHVDGGTSRFDKNGVVYQAVCCGCGGYSDFPTTPDAWSSTNNSVNNNCNALTFKFDFNLIPDAAFSVSESIGCSPFEVHFDNLSSQSDAYMWHFDNGDLDSTTFEPTKIYTVPGTYDVMLTVTDSVCALTDTMILTIEVYPTLELELQPDFVLCTPVPITLTADGKGTGTSFLWSSNSNFTDTLNNYPTDSIAFVNEPLSGYYYVKISNNGCSLVDSVKVEYIGATLQLSGTQKLCLNELDTIHAISTNPNVSFSNFDWYSNQIIISGDGTSSVIIQPDSTQFVYVTATANNGCVVHDSILVQVSQIPDSLIDATASETEVPIGGETTLTASPDGYSYLWFPQQGIENPTYQETDATVKHTTIYTVAISDGICTKTASVKVSAYPFVCDHPYIFVPNAFSPNSDGKNDLLMVRSQVVQEIVFRVYNRWGQKVYETNRTNTGWNGNYKGKLADPDVYDYYMEGTCIDGQHFLIKGNITLIR